MEINKYLKCLVKDFITACGFLMIVVLAVLTTYSIDIIKVSLLWQIVLVASAFTFLKLAFVNKFELRRNAQMIQLTICSTVADIMIILWLFLFSPGKINDKNLIMMYIIIIFIVKGAVYAMTYIDGKKQAEQINEKLNQYKKGVNK